MIIRQKRKTRCPAAAKANAESSEATPASLSISAKELTWVFTLLFGMIGWTVGQLITKMVEGVPVVRYHTSIKTKLNDDERKIYRARVNLRNLSKEITLEHIEISIYARAKGGNRYVPMIPDTQDTIVPGTYKPTEISDPKLENNQVVMNHHLVEFPPLSEMVYTTQYAVPVDVFVRGRLAPEHRENEEDQKASGFTIRKGDWETRLAEHEIRVYFWLLITLFLLLMILGLPSLRRWILRGLRQLFKFSSQVWRGFEAPPTKPNS